MKKLLLLTLLCFSINGFAFNWVKVITSTADGVTIYIDTNSIQKKGNLIYVWELQDYLEPKSIGSGITMSSSVTKYKIGCDELKSMPVVYEIYSSNMGRGRLVDSYSAKSSGNDKWSRFKLGAYGWFTITMACENAK
jgi:hypothetical protein